MRTGKRFGLGIGMFSGGGLLALYGLGCCWLPRSSGWPRPCGLAGGLIIGAGLWPRLGSPRWPAAQS